MEYTRILPFLLGLLAGNLMNEPGDVRPHVAVHMMKPCPEEEVAQQELIGFLPHLVDTPVEAQQVPVSYMPLLPVPDYDEGSSW